MTQVTRDILYKATFCEDIIDKIIDYAVVVDSEMLIRLHKVRLLNMYTDLLNDMEKYQLYYLGSPIDYILKGVSTFASYDHYNYCEENELDYDTSWAHDDAKGKDIYIYQGSYLLNLTDADDTINNGIYINQLR